MLRFLRELCRRWRPRRPRELVDPDGETHRSVGGVTVAVTNCGEPLAAEEIRQAVARRVARGEAP
jgi:hypothetical protein